MYFHITEAFMSLFTGGDSKKGVSVAIIKPNIVKDGKVDEIIEDVSLI